jgi:hypothetical protein
MVSTPGRAICSIPESWKPSGRRAVSNVASFFPAQEPSVSNSDLLNLIQAGVFSILALGIGLPLGRALVHRVAGPRRTPALPSAADGERLDRIERAIEAIAV